MWGRRPISTNAISSPPTARPNVHRGGVDIEALLSIGLLLVSVKLKRLLGGAAAPPSLPARFSKRWRYLFTKGRNRLLLDRTAKTKLALFAS